MKKADWPWLALAGGALVVILGLVAGAIALRRSRVVATHPEADTPAASPVSPASATSTPVQGGAPAATATKAAAIWM